MPNRHKNQLSNELMCPCDWMKQLSNINPSVSQPPAEIKPGTPQLAAQCATTELPLTYICLWYDPDLFNT